ncbi:MAG: hypothetical protein DRQ88_01340 [Epsilonproteobacteria bacterium]|nr:MAG: hypothetical protein DRQ89_05410 [Campylobacterota bacterium]RLA67937.1 MAG: hypothetical protein DRQ88_01340 [Campylobacterota bacterium]
MESFIKLINFINSKLEDFLIFVRNHMPNFKEKARPLFKKFNHQYEKFINWIYGSTNKKKGAAPKYKQFYSFIFSPSFISVTILVSTIVFFHKQALRLGQEKPIDDVVKEIYQLKQLRKPAFFKYKEREFLVDDIYFPIYIKSTNSIKRLILSLNLRASNRYIKTFFTENNAQNLDLIYDKLNLTTEEIIPHFPLTNEGKYIIKRKIKIELDILLKDLGIKGEIEKVFISQIIGA